MQKKLSILKLLCLVLFVGMISCKGDEGPIGPAGPTGPTGATGSAGTNGTNGAPGATGSAGQGVQNCIECHGSSQLIAAKVFQYGASDHASSVNVTRNTTTCAPCHTSQGYVERIGTGLTTTAATIINPLPQNCYTCHQIHKTFTKADWALTTSAPVTLWVGGAVVNGGKSNHCIQCHQSRPRTPALPNAATGGDFSNTSTGYHPHYGAEGNLFMGKTNYEVGTGYTNSAHTLLIKDGCVTCHMATAIGKSSGGHTFATVDYSASTTGTMNTNGCVACHTVPATLTAQVSATRTEIDALLKQLEDLLLAKGLIDATNKNAIGTTAAPKVYKGHEMGAVWNYKTVYFDASRGMHNFKYTKTLLTNSINAIK